MRRTLLFLLLSISVYSVSEFAASQDKSKTILSGTLNCNTREVGFSKGPLKGKTFLDIERAVIAMREQGYSGEGLQTLKEILMQICKRENQDPIVSQRNKGGNVSPMVFEPSLVLEIEVVDRMIKFSLLQPDLSTYASFEDYLRREEGQEACRSISERCEKCPNGKIYCRGITIRSKEK